MGSPAQDRDRDLSESPGMSQQTFHYERAKLYEEVWTEPVRTVAKRYGISGVALAKICRKLKVPVPGRGYWAEKQAGKEPVRASLPVLPTSAPTTITTVRTVPDGGPLVEPKVLARVHEERSSDKIIVPNELTAPHALVERSAELLRKVPENGFVFARNKPCLDIAVGSSTLERALRIADALIKALEARGIPVAVVDKPNRADPSSISHATRVVVDGEEIEWGLAEGSRREMGPPPPPPKDYTGAMRTSWLKYKQPEPIHVPNGVLALEIHGERYVSLGTRSTWKDGRHQRVETCLNGFIAELFTTAAALKRRREGIERSRREWEEKTRRHQEAVQRQQDEANREKELADQLNRWRMARDARQYVKELVEAAVAEGHDIPADSRLGLRLAWVSAYADRLDPVAAVRNDLRAALAPG